MFSLKIFLVSVLLHSIEVFAGLKNTSSTAWIEEQKYPRNCYEATIKPSDSDVRLIQFDNYGPKSFLVSCERGFDGGGWTVIQRRMDGNVNFYRGWHDYKFGFGDLTREFWIGLDKLHALTNDALQELLIVLENFEGEIRTAKYDRFAIGDENEGYALKLLGKYSGTAGDSLDYHRSYKFTTKDKNNGPANSNCAVSFTGAWWYNYCHFSNLNGQYIKAGNDKSGKNITWKHWTSSMYSLKFTQMMIRPKI